MTVKYLDPTNSPDKGESRMSDRPDSLTGLTVGLLDNGKTKADHLLDLIAENLKEDLDDISFETIEKPTPFKPAPEELIDDVASRFGAVITGIGD